MKSLKNTTSALCAAALAAAMICVFATPAFAGGKAADLSVQDVDGQWRNFPPTGRLCVVMYTNADLEQESKALSKALDPYRGTQDFMFVQVVDLRGDIAPIARRLVEKQIRKELDLEAARVKPFYVQNGSKANPRADLSTIADYGGSVLNKLGWNDRVESIRFVIYNAQGVPIKRIDDTQDHKIVSSYFRSLFGAHTAGSY